jgi:hypothetical protein
MTNQLLLVIELRFNTYTYNEQYATTNTWQQTSSSKDVTTNLQQQRKMGFLNYSWWLQYTHDCQILQFFFA